MEKHTLSATVCTGLLLLAACAESGTVSTTGDTDPVDSDAAASGDEDAEPAPGPDAEPDPDPREPAPEEDVDLSPMHFDPEVVQTVHIEIDPDHWEVLRNQGRTIMDILGEDCMSGSGESPFTWFPANVTINGVEVPESGVRKKGFLGSLNPLKPSLKLKFDKYVEDQELGGMERFTLNNANQDLSHLNTCMAYGLFHAAGLPAPRCNYARVTVNDWELGVFVNVEPVKKRFLRRWFDDDEGKLYEGTLSDFRDEWTQSLVKKTNEEEADDRSEIAALTEALTVPDDDLIPALEQWIDLSTFYRYWALEVLMGHWDGYNGNRNNFFVYLDPTTGRFTFIPWGPDASFGPLEGLSDTPDLPRAVMARSALSFRLYHHPEGRQGYLDAMQWLLDEVWDEEALHAEIDRMADLVGPFMESWESPKAKEDTPRLHAFVDGRRAEIETELGEGGASWPEELGAPPCMEPVGEVQITYATTWGTANQEDIFQSGTGTFHTQHKEWGDVVLPYVGSSAGMSDEPEAWNQAKLLVLGFLEDGGILGVRIHLPPESLAPQSSVPLDFEHSEGVMFYLDPGGSEPSLVGFLVGGGMEFEEAGTGDGDVITGSLSSDLLSWAF